MAESREVKAHLANSGRVRELLVPGAVLYLAPAGAPGRKTAFDVQLVEAAGVLVSADARLPPRLLAERILASPPDGLDGYDQVSSEVRLGESRIDLMLSGGAEKMYVETKSVTLVTDGVGLFPDSPTTRGRKHVMELAEAVGPRVRAAGAFVIQRPDAAAFMTNNAADPEFAEALETAHRGGVEVFAFRCAVTPREIRITDAVPWLRP